MLSITAKCSHQPCTTGTCPHRSTLESVHRQWAMLQFQIMVHLNWQIWLQTYNISGQQDPAPTGLQEVWNTDSSTTQKKAHDSRKNAKALPNSAFITGNHTMSIQPDWCSCHWHCQVASFSSSSGAVDAFSWLSPNSSAYCSEWTDIYTDGGF